MEYVQVDSAPRAIGPYSQAVRVGNLLFTSGMIALDPQSGQMVGNDAAAQMRQALRNLQALLEGAGASFARVVKTTLYLADMNDFATVNEIYAAFFGESKPARSTVAVKTLPKSALVEIDAIAVFAD